MLRLTVSSVLLTSMLSAATALAAPEIPVTVCGQVLPVRARGVLTADLDCTGRHVGVVLGPNASLSLGGFTLTAGFDGIECLGNCSVTGPGTISGGENGVWSSEKGKVFKANGVTFSGATTYGIYFDRIQLENSTVSGAGYFGVQGRRSAKIENCSISDSFGALSVEHAVVKGSTLSASDFGISGGTVVLKDGSSVDTSGGPPSAWAIRTVKRPRLSSDSICLGRSMSLGEPVPSWGVCSLD